MNRYRHIAAKEKRGNKRVENEETSSKIWNGDLSQQKTEEDNLALKERAGGSFRDADVLIGGRNCLEELVARVRRDDLDVNPQGGGK